MARSRKTFTRLARLVGVLSAALLLSGCASPASESKVDDLNDAATVAYLEENARTLAAGYGITDPPKVEVVRLIALSEWGETQIGCLKAAGFDVEATPDGEGISYRNITDPALMPALNLAIYTCEVQYPVSPRYHRPLSTDQLRALYHYRTNDLPACLKKLGLEYSATPPSEEVFIQSEGGWSPYEGLSFSEEQAPTVYKGCPQVPDELYNK